MQPLAHRLAALVAMTCVAPAWSEGAAVFADAEAAFSRAMLVAGNGETMSPEEASAANAVLASALQQAPNARWELGLALVAFDARKWTDAQTHAERATELDPTLADAHYWLGNSLFSGINEVGMLEKGSFASRGRKAYERAIELNPNFIGARFGLAQFFAGAPGIAGGSDKKAKQQAEALIAIEGGAMWGHSVLAQLAANDSKWSEASKQFEAASSAASTDDERIGVLRSHGAMLLRKKKDAAAALPIAETLVKERPDDLSARYLLGLTQHALKNYAAAIECFTTILETRPDSANPLFALAESQRDSGLLGAALASFESFATKHEKDDRASDAKSEAKKLRKKLSKK